MTRVASYLGLSLVLLFVTACGSTRPYVAGVHADWRDLAPPPASDLTYRIFLVGNAGAPGTDGASPALRLLAAELGRAGERSAVIFLGNHAGCCGLPDSADAGRAAAEAYLNTSLRAVDGYAGRVLFAPGHRDWNNAGRGGQAALAREEGFIEARLDRGNAFLPDGGFPGPVRVRLSDDITVLVLDTQWWLHPHDKPFGDTGEYDLHEAGDVLRELDDLLRRERNRDVLVVGHHPLLSNGPHAGRFPARAHLTPLPVLGSAYPLYRRLVGREQDLADAPYSTLRHELSRSFAEYDLIYASAHEHSLQYFRQGTPRAVQHHIVSGAAARAGHVAPGGNAAFTASRTGFVTLQYYRDRSIWMEAWSPDDDGGGALLFRTRLKPPDPPATDGIPPAPPDEAPDYRDSTVTLAPNPAYAAGPVKRFFLGSHNRALWATPVTVPVLDVGSAEGGLTPVKLGGRGQSVSMRLENDAGHEYVLRSIDKVAGKVWSPALRNTFLLNLTQDQFSMLHPHGAFIVPPLARAAGVYHTNPRLVFVPDDPRLGLHRGELVGRMALLEERPDGDMSGTASVGYAEEVISTATLFREVDADNDHRVDARAFARARLFDMLIGDWDRHDDQWRWAAFEPPDSVGKIYRPIPRDRDVAFMRFNGVLPTLARVFFDPKYQDFDYDYGYLKGFNKNGLALDRRFTSPLGRDDWVSIADSIRLSLTDAVIEAAVRQWPEPVYARSGEETIGKLKSRRDALPDAAARYYGILAHTVDVVGSHKHERFEVTRREGATEVVVYKTSKRGEIRRELYRRVFRHDETEELRLYGFDGNDRFIVDGTARSGLRVIAVGGSGEDAFEDHSSVAGPGQATHFYDTEAGNTWAPGTEARIFTSDAPGVNAYDLHGFKYDLTRPVTFFGANKDDGVFIGGGIKATRHGFRKQPYARMHRLEANVAAATQAFNVRYRGHYVAISGRWDLDIEAMASSPNTIYNFYGLGNETPNEDGDAKYYQARMTRVTARPRLQRQPVQGLTVGFGPTFEYIDVREDVGRFVNQPQAGVSPGTFEAQWYAGLEAGLALTTLDAPANPRQGFAWENTARLNLALKHASTTYATFASALRLYLSPSLSPQVTLALRVGAAHNEGAFPFYASNALGGAFNLRGHRSTRFAGRTSFYQNAELRAGLFDFGGYLGYGTFGLLAFLDNGRVWTDGEDSRRWHQGYGGGLWVDFFEAFVFSAALGLSDDDTTFHVGFGFLY